MRYSKSSVLALALTVACSAVDFSAVANAQNSNHDFPWRSKTSAKAAVNTAKTAVNTVKSSLATPARDLTTSETIATPTPRSHSMPSFIYHEGKKYVRQGDTYVESPSVAVASAARENFNSYASNAAQIPAVKKTSLFQKTKDLTGRLNPFSKSMRSETAYRSSDWKVPSFSKSLASFSKKDNDPITFAAVTPLPAKSSVPASLDSVPTQLASKDSYKAPALASPARDSQFKSALPTETKLTSVFAKEKEDSSSKDFKLESSSVANMADKTQLPKIPSSFDTETKTSSAKDFSPEASSVAKLSGQAKLPKLPSSFTTKPKVSSAVSNSAEGFTFTQQVSTKAVAPMETKSASTFSVEPKARLAESKSATEITQKVSQDFSPVAEATSEIRSKVSEVKSKVVESKVVESKVVESKVVKPARKAPVRVAHELSADNEFWSPRR